MEKQKYKVKKYDGSSLLSENKKLSKEYKRQVKFTIISVFFVTIIMISSAYAIFSDVTRQESNNTLTVGKLKVDFIDTESGMGNIINLNGAYPVADSVGNQTAPYIFKITNSGTLDASYVVKIIDDQEVIDEDGCSNNQLGKDKIRVSIDGGTPFTLSEKATNSYIIDSGNLLKNASKTYSIRIWISDQSGNEVLGKHYHGKIVVDSENMVVNGNILEAYTYNETQTEAGTPTCVNGEEETCIPTKCYENRAANSCSQGTIIKYKVNENESYYFYVLHDDGQTMTLQQRENTIKNIAWHAEESNNRYGPDTVLPALEQATNTWTNVNELNYEPGVSSLYENVGAQCTWNGGESGDYKITCNNNPYTSSTLGTRNNARARIITAFEASSTGCLFRKDDGSDKRILDNSINTSNYGSCPDFMQNYLYLSSRDGGSYDDNTEGENEKVSYGYWTMSANYGESSCALRICRYGALYVENVSSTPSGVRAVIQINK